MVPKPVVVVVVEVVVVVVMVELVFGVVTGVVCIVSGKEFTLQDVVTSSINFY